MKADSGGPLVQFLDNKAVLIGIETRISLRIFTDDRVCSENVIRSTYAPVPYFIEWILETIVAN